MDKDQQWAVDSKSRGLMLDRERRRLYIGLVPNIRLFLNLERLSRLNTMDDGAMDDDDETELSGADLLEMVRECEPKDLTANSPTSVSRSTMQSLRMWLDDHGPMDLDEFEPTVLQSCDFDRTYITVLPGHIEQAFGYKGHRRYVSLHWCPKEDSVFVCDGLGSRLLSPTRDTWLGFLRHPLVAPHVKYLWRNSQQETVSFEARNAPIAHPELFSTEEQARFMDADVETACIIYDRATNQLHLGVWTSALWFHSLVDEVLHEDLVPDGQLPEPETPLLSWLDDQRDNPQHLFAIAARNHDGTTEQTLTLLRQCLDKSPDSHFYWYCYSQTLGSAGQWDEALEACDKALALHSTAPHQSVTAAQMLKWKAHNLVVLKRYTEAVSIFQLLLEFDFPDFAEGYSQLARCYQRMGNYSEALEMRRRQLKECERSLTHALEDTMLANEEIIEMERFDVSEALLKLGQAQVLCGDIDEAEASFRRAINEDSNNIHARAELGALLRATGREAEGTFALRESLSLLQGRAQAGRKDDPGQEGHRCRQMALLYAALAERELSEEMSLRAEELGERDLLGEQIVVSAQALASGNFAVSQGDD